MQSYSKTRLPNLTFICIKSKLPLKRLGNRPGNWYESENSQLVSFAYSCSIESKQRPPAARHVITTIVNSLLNLICSKKIYAVVLKSTCT